MKNKYMSLHDLTKISYKKFMLWKFLDEDTILGDLAKDIKSDKSFPNTLKLDEVKKYIEHIPTCAGANKAFKHSLMLYEYYYYPAVKCALNKLMKEK